MMKRIAFPLFGGQNWLGGYNYLLNLFTVLDRYPQPNIQPVLFVGSDFPHEHLSQFRRLSGLEVVITPVFSRQRAIKSFVLSCVLGHDPQVKRLLQEYQISIIFLCAQFYGFNIGIPQISWIPDFQHRVIPENFTFLQKLKREIGFRLQIKSATQVLISSNVMQQQLRYFYSHAASKSTCISFAVATKSLWQQSCQDVRERYSLPSKYFFFPGQFYSHKNHLAVINALFHLHNNGLPVSVVCTGKEFDPLNPKYAKRILTAVKSLPLNNLFLSLGVVPYEHVVSIMEHSLALLNPSFSEGWSTTVEESKSINKPLILSNLPVHFEQTSGRAAFFDPSNHLQLANTLDDAWSSNGNSLIAPLAEGCNYSQLLADFSDNISRMMNTVING